MTTLPRALLSHYRRHPVQALFLLTGIVVANVLLVGTLLINAQARASYEQGETLLRAGPVGQVRHRDGSRPIDERDYLRLRLQGFDMLAPVLRQLVQVGNGERLELLGIDLFAMPRAPERVSGRPPGRALAGADSGRGQANPGFAEFAFPPWQLWAAPGRIEQLGWRAGERPVLASAELLPPVVAMPGEDLGHRLLIDVGALQSLTGSAGQLSSMWVFAAPEDRLAALRKALPGELEFVAAAAAPNPAELTRSFHLNLAAMGLMAFVVGVFLTYNALTFSYTDRRELLRKLQLCGVTRPELTRALLLELAVFLGAGSLLGGWLGVQLAGWLLPGVGRTLAQLYGVYIAYPDGLLSGGLLSGGLVPGGFLLPLLMTAVAAGLCVLFPLREALDTPLLQRWQAGWQLQVAARRDRLLMAGGGVLLLAAAAAGVAATSLRWALAGMASLLIGAVLCLPMVLRLLLGALGRYVPPRHARLSWLLADSRWLLGPASLALMALTLALVANSGLNAMIGSFRQATDDWLQQRLAAQLYLRGEPELAGAQLSSLESWLAQQDPRLHAVERYRIELNRPAAHGQAVPVEVVSLQQGERFLDSIQLLRAEQDAPRRFDLGEGVYVSERAWRVDGWRPGAALALCPGRADLPVLGVYHDYGNPRSQWMVSRALFRQCWPEQSPAGRGIYGPEDADWGGLRRALRDHFGFEDEQVVDQAEIKATGMSVFDRTFTVTRALNALTLLVAGIGIFCAVSAIQHHRVGQQAVLASLGVTRRERGALLLLQWGLLGLLCMVLVWPFGAALAGYLTYVVTPVAFGWSFPLRLQWAHYFVLAGIALTALALAVILPSLRLLRTSPAAMLREQAL
jgi:putative ABC transport system permease protein